MDIHWIDAPWPGRLAIFARPRGAEWLADDVHAWKAAGLDVIVSLLTQAESDAFDLDGERQLCEQQGLEFFHFPIVDVSVPVSRDATLKLVRKLERRLDKGDNVGIHCSHGVGRSGMIAACLLILPGIPPEEAMETVSAARGVVVPQTSEQREWVEAFAEHL